MVVPLHMGWRHALFANWPVTPDVVRPMIPDTLTLDTFDDRAWLSVIPFTNVDVRPWPLPSGTGIRLPELNLRTYVTFDGTPGVYFFSLDTDRLLAVLGARLFHHLPYYYASTKLGVDDDTVRFASRRRHPGARPVEVRATYRPVESPAPADPESVEEFLTARHRYYTESAAGDLRYAHVDHKPWPLSDVEVTIDAESLFRANGFAPPRSDPVYFYSPGVDTVASRSKVAEWSR